MPLSPLDIADDELFALMKFRRNVKDLLKPGQDDHFLLRWLRARNWNPDAAEVMLRESLKWREEWQIDTLEEKWTPPEVFPKYYPSGVCGFDREGCPVVIVPFAGLDMWGMIHSARRSDFIRYTALKLEGFLRVASENSAHQLVAVMDMEDFNMKQYVHRPAAELVVTLIKTYEANYPEILKACFVINVSRMFYIAFSLIKGFLREETLNKIHIIKGDKKKYLPALLKLIEPDQLPKHFGGTQVDENGDERCSAKVKQGGKIPKSYYYRKPERKMEDVGNVDMTTTEIKKGAKFVLDFDASTPNAILKYEFKVEGGEVKFGAVRLNENGEETEEIPVQKFSTSKLPEIGVITHDKPTTYRITFTNCNMLTSLKLHHQIQLLPPLTEGIVS